MEQPRQGERAARNQSLFREVNEQVASLNQMFDELTPYGSWACECASVDCLERIPMTLGEYETLREFPNRFAVLPSEAHLIPEVEHAVQKTERYWGGREDRHRGRGCYRAKQGRALMAEPEGSLRSEIEMLEQVAARVEGRGRPEDQLLL